MVEQSLILVRELKSEIQHKTRSKPPADAELSRYDPDVPRWDSLPEDERKLYARMMEVFAGFLEHTDHHIGRLLDFLKTIDEFDNTVVMVLSDNGASSEGGPEGSINENMFFNNVTESLEENLAALEITLAPEELAELERLFPVGAAAGTRYPPRGMTGVDK